MREGISLEIDPPYVLLSIARLWQATDDKSILTSVASIFETSFDEVERRFHNVINDQKNE